MAPAKKSKSVNKGFGVVNEVSPSKDDKANKQKKRKLSDMLGPQWSKHELQQFYEAYRKYGQDWKKVAGVVRSRSINMVEALYNMNRAYLSLPEGTASVVGLIAMMTDHYNVMGGSGSERESDEHGISARKPQKYPKTKVRVDSPREDSIQRQSIGSSDRFLSLLKTRGDGIQPYFPVRKRTPRVPVSCLAIPPNKKPRGTLMNGNKDEVSRGALLLTEARQMPGSPHVPQATYREPEHIKPSLVSAREKVAMYRVAALGEQSAEGSLGSSEAKNGDLVRDSLDSGKSAFAEYKKGRKKGKKDEVELTEAKLFDGIQEAYYDADRGPRVKAGSEGAGAKFHKSSDGQKKRNKELMVEDEREACDALQTLAEMSLMMPYLAAEPVEDGGESVTGRDTMVGRNAHHGVTSKDDSTRREYKKRKSQASKAEVRNDHCRKLAENEVDEEVKSAASSGQITAVSKKCKSSVRSPDVSSSNDRQMGETEVAVSSEHVNPASQVNRTRRKSIRKRDRKLLQKDRSYAQSTCSSECSSLLQDRVPFLKEKILHCLSWQDVRRWCAYEWFYSAIDYPWFAKREFVEYLNHVGLGHIPRLTRVEWGVIRSSLGKPRRFSERFLQEEREKLKQYRESVRTHYANLRAGLGEGLPTDLARPLSVGQQVVAIHPKTREVHNGCVLTVDRHNCLVQFDHPDLGVELVMDIECMPLNPVENMPEALRREKILFDYRCSQESKVNGKLMFISEHMQNLDHQRVSPFNQSITSDAKVKPACMSSYPQVTGSRSQGTQSATQNPCCNMAHMQPRLGGVRPSSVSTQSLERKALEQQGIFPGKPSCWPQHVANSVGPNGTVHSSNNLTYSCQETASNVAEIVEGSRDKARRMVDIAIKAVSLMKEGEDAFARIGEALDANNKAQRTNNYRMHSNTAQAGLPLQNPVTSCISETQLAGDASGMKSADSSPASDLQVPSNLITSCVATLLMIQTCTERQYPPAEVAQILDNAVTSLHPCSSQNLSIYREIQMCMGRIKTQILALVPI